MLCTQSLLRCTIHTLQHARTRCNTCSTRSHTATHRRLIAQALFRFTTNTATQCKALYRTATHSARSLFLFFPVYSSTMYFCLLATFTVKHVCVCVCACVCVHMCVCTRTRAPALFISSHHYFCRVHQSTKRLLLSNRQTSFPNQKDAFS